MTRRSSPLRHLEERIGMGHRTFIYVGSVYLNHRGSGIRCRWNVDVKSGMSELRGFRYIVVAVEEER